jgi:hypothetical protein
MRRQTLQSLFLALGAMGGRMGVENKQDKRKTITIVPARQVLCSVGPNPCVPAVA